MTKSLSRTLVMTAAVVGLSSIAAADEGKQHQEQGMSKKGERALQRVYFDFNSVVPTEDVLMTANLLQCNPNETIILDAYTDPVGSDEVNAEVALRRAQAVRDQLVAVGIDEDRIMISVFGEQGDRQKTHALDRRVEIRTSDESVAELRDRRENNAIAVVAPGENLDEVALP